MKKIFLSIAILSFLIPNIVLAQANAQGWTDTACADAGGRWYANTCLAKPPEVTLQIPVGKLASGEIDIATYIKNLYEFSMAAIAVLAVIMIMVGGFIWLTAGGNQERVTSAKGYMTGAVVGLVIALGSFTILRLLNPSLVFFAPLKIPMVKQAYLASDLCPQKVPEGQSVTCEGIKGGEKLGVGTPIACGWNCEIGEGQDVSACKGSYVDEPGLLCLPNVFLDKNNNLKFDGLKPSEACDNFSQANLEDIGMEPNQGSCDVINTAIRASADKDKLPDSEKGTCVWVDETVGQDNCVLCNMAGWNKAKQIIEEEMKDDNQTKEQVCNELTTHWAWSEYTQACTLKFCFGYGGVGPGI